MKGFRILARSIRDSFKSVFRNFSLSLASISCITITLIVVSIAIILSFNVNNFATLVEKDVSIVTFLDTEITDEEFIEIEKEIAENQVVATAVEENVIETETNVLSETQPEVELVEEIVEIETEIITEV